MCAALRDTSQGCGDLILVGVNAEKGCGVT